MKSSRAVESRNVVGHHHSQKPDDLIITNGSKSLSTKQSGCRLSHVYSHGHFKCSVGWNRNQWVHMDGFLKSSISRWDFRFPLFYHHFWGTPMESPTCPTPPPGLPRRLDTSSSHSWPDGDSRRVRQLPGHWAWHPVDLVAVGDLRHLREVEMEMMGKPAKSTGLICHGSQPAG